MKNIEPIDIRVIESHLKRFGAGVDLTWLPWKPSDNKGFKLQLDTDDIVRLVIWHEAHIHTNGTCRVIDVVPETANHPRVKPFIEGHPVKGGPVDLRTCPNLELVVVTNDLERSILYIIDGGHRSMAQFLAHKDFQDVWAFACVHPRMLTWGNIPPRYRMPFR